MKKILLYFILLLITALNVASGQRRAPVGEDWKLSEEEASGMLERMHECGLFKPCNNKSKIIDPENEQYKWIVAKYSQVAVITLVDARYRNNDEDRYRRLRDITESARYKVKGYKTKLVKVQFHNASQLTAGETSYYDCYTICPPPDPCPEAEAEK